MNDNKKNLIYIIPILVLIIVIILYEMIVNKNSTAISSLDLIKDTYVTEDYYNDVIYENTIYVPKEMTRVIQSLKTANYVYRKDKKSFTIQYSSCIDENCINSYKSSDEYKQEGKYYVYKSENKIKVYFKNSFDIYQTVEINKYNYENESLKDDKTYIKLLENMTSKKANYDKYYINPKDGYYEGNILYNDYQKEDDITFYKIGYKVDSTKYQTVYDKNDLSTNLYLDKTHMSFYEGKITTDISSVKAQTRIQLFVIKSLNLDINEEAISSMDLSLNQSAFDDVSKDDVEIKIDSIDYNDNKIDYYHIISNNNNSYGERISAYLKLKDNYYYVIQIYGGEGKNLSIDMINDFLPTTISTK